MCRVESFQDPVFTVGLTVWEGALGRRLIFHTKGERSCVGKGKRKLGLEMEVFVRVREQRNSQVGLLSDGAQAKG